MTDPSARRTQRAAYYRTLGKRISTLRKEREWTQAEVARMLGVSQQTLFAYELGDRKLPLDRAALVASLFRLPLDQLAGLKPAGPFSPGRLSPRLARHLDALKKLTLAEQRMIIRVTNTAAKQRESAAPTAGV